MPVRLGEVGEKGGIVFVTGSNLGSDSSLLRLLLVSWWWVQCLVLYVRSGQSLHQLGRRENSKDNSEEIFLPVFSEGGHHEQFWHW